MRFVRVRLEAEAALFADRKAAGSRLIFVVLHELSQVCAIRHTRGQHTACTVVIACATLMNDEQSPHRARDSLSSSILEASHPPFEW